MFFSQIFDKLPDEICKEIHSYLYPIGDTKLLEYKQGVIWCQNCGEKLKKGDWFLYMTDYTVIVSYTCNLCNYENVYTENDEWDILVDYVNS